MKRFVLISLILGMALTACAGKRVRLIYDRGRAPDCERVVDSFFSDFRQPTPKEFDMVLECIEKLRNGYEQEGEFE